MTDLRVIKECVVVEGKPLTADSGVFEVGLQSLVDELVETGLVEIVSAEPVEMEHTEEEDLSYLESVPEVAETVKSLPKKKRKKR